MVIAILRDSFFGWCCRFVTGGRVFKYPEEVQASIWQHYLADDDPFLSTIGLALPKFTGDRRSKPKRRLSDEIPLREIQHNKIDTEKGPTDSEESWEYNEAINPDWEVDRRAGLYIVGWYGPGDPENPQNWSAAKKLFVTFEVCLLTFAVYIAAAIYSSAVADIARAFGVSHFISISGLTLFVVGYGFGPMLWSPLSEVPAVGRTSIYILTLVAFVALQVPTALATNISVLLGLRFLAGFMGSPSLATGGASIAEMFTPTKGAYGMALWGLFCICGPTLGPLIGGFAVEARDWTWVFLVVFWISSFTLLILFFLLPETSAANILHRRANRLRKLTGNLKLVCEVDIASNEGGMTVKDMLMNTLVRPFTVTFTEPIVLALNLYSAFIYGLLYMWFESFPIVFIEIYGFGLGTSGLMFLGILIGAILTLPGYFWWLRVSLEPKVAKHGDLVPEWILPPCYVGAISLPVCLFWFGWTSRAEIHWIVPVIGTAFFSVAIVLLFNALLNYLVLAYPTQAATVLAGNDLSRCLVGATFPLFATNIYEGLGVAWSTSVLGFIAVAFTPIPFILVKYGTWLRNKSKMARHDL
ncbi:MFS transporter [Diaporthe sp. PMI_573]|nr:MFS transporter [Diaporthaceae sp. PMI_573]